MLLRAWAEEFAPGEPVRLVVVTYRGAGAAAEGSVEEQAVAHLAALGAGPDEVADIELVLDPVPHDAMRDLYASADAFVLPTRGEGAGMPVLEAAACGVPVIATAWGGHEELMTAEAAFPVAVERMVEAPPALLVGQRALRGPAAGRAVGRRRCAPRCAPWPTIRRPPPRAGCGARAGGGAVLARRHRRGRSTPAPGRCSARPAGGGAVKLVWRGPVTDPSGYAAGGRAFLRGLQEEGADVRLEPHMWNAREAIDAAERRRLVAMSASGSCATSTPRCSTRSAASSTRTRPGASGWAARCSRPTASRPTGSPAATRWTRCGCRPSTTARRSPPPAWTAGGSRWCRSRSSSTASTARAAPLPLEDAHGTVFLAAFDWTLRKGWDVLLRAWCDAFDAGDDVTLVLKVWATTRGVGTAEIQAEIIPSSAAMGRDPGAIADLVIVEDLLRGADMCRLYAAADAVVAPTRGEGWGRPLLEAMAMGRPVIATGWSGPAAFVDAEVGLGAGVRRWCRCRPPPPPRSPPSPATAGPSRDATALAAAMRDVHERPAEARGRGAAAARRAQRYDHRAVAREALAPARRRWCAGRPSACRWATGSRGW